MMVARRALAIAWKDLLEDLRSWETVFWLVLFPIFMLLLTNYAFIPRGTQLPELRVGAVNVQDPLGEALVTAMNASVDGSRLFRVKIYDNASLALADLRKGWLDAVLILPDNFLNKTICGEAEVKVFVLATETGQGYSVEQVVRGFLSAFLDRVRERHAEIMLRWMVCGMRQAGYPEETIERARAYLERYLRGIVHPATVSVEQVSPRALESRARVLGWMTLAMIGVEFLFVGFCGASAGIVAEREHGRLRQLLATPMTAWDLLAGKTLALLVECLLSALVCVLVGIFGIGAEIPFDATNPAHYVALLALLLVALFSIGVGLIISAFARTSRGASSLGSSLAFVLMFISGIWFPRWILPAPLRRFADVFPATRALDVARELIVFERPLSAALSGAVLPLLVINAAVYVAGVVAFHHSVKKSLR